MNANAPTLTESVRIPLHELQADVDYLIGRVVADGSCAPMIAASIKVKLVSIETALIAPNGRGAQGVWEYNNELGEKELVGWERAQRPAGSNADEWQLFLREYLGDPSPRLNDYSYVAVKIAEAIEVAERRGRQPCGECHLKPDEVCDVCGKREPSLNQEGREHPGFDNPRDPFASPDRLPCRHCGGSGVAPAGTVS